MKTPFLLLFFSLLLTSAAAERVISLSPNLTEAICLIGGKSLLAGRTDSCTTPSSVTGIPSVGKFLSPSPERIAALAPTLVVSTPQPGRGTAQLLASLKIRFVELPDRTLEDYPALLRRLGRLLNLPAGEREALLAEKRLAALRRDAATVPENEKISVLFLAGIDPAVVAGRRSFIHQMIELAGGRNLAGNLNRTYVTVSPEWIAEQQPDLVLIAGNASVLPEWLRALPVRPLPDPDLVCRLGPRLFSGVERLKNILKNTSKGNGSCH